MGPSKPQIVSLLDREARVTRQSLDRQSTSIAYIYRHIKQRPTSSIATSRPTNYMQASTTSNKRSQGEDGVPSVSTRSPILTKAPESLSGSKFLFEKTLTTSVPRSSPSSSHSHDRQEEGPASASKIGGSGSRGGFFGLKTRHRATVIHEELLGHRSVPSSHHSSDPWHQWEGLVIILVILHVLVILFYAW